MTVVLYFDGRCEPNPGGIATYGFVIRDGGALVAAEGGPVDGRTNNVAEYTGLIRGLERAAALGLRDFEVRGDSKLVIFQVRGAWRVRDKKLGPLFLRARELGDAMGATYRWVPREENREADAMTEKAALEIENRPRGAGGL